MEQFGLAMEQVFMKQYEAVIKIMEENGGYATLNHLYENF